MAMDGASLRTKKKQEEKGEGQTNEQHTNHPAGKRTNQKVTRDLR